MTRAAVPVHVQPARVPDGVAVEPAAAERVVPTVGAEDVAGGGVGDVAGTGLPA